mmetsp:Transcript_12933/g.24479  ORF Transcript_12933/g.24479 Transcript_12933/m.24479 type:complete len:246 (-) Transcript_12933:296-1033(-)
MRAARERPRLAHLHRPKPVVPDVPRNGVVTSRVVDARGVVHARSELVREYLVPQLLLREDAADEVSPQVLEIEVVLEEAKHLGRADVNVAVNEVLPDGNLRPVEECRRHVERHVALVDLLLVAYDLVRRRVDLKDQAVVPEPLSRRPRLDSLHHNRHNRALVLLPPLLVLRNGFLEVEGRDRVARYQHEVGRYHGLVVNDSHRFTHRHAVGRDDRHQFHSHVSVLPVVVLVVLVLERPLFFLVAR